MANYINGSGFESARNEVETFSGDAQKIEIPNQSKHHELVLPDALTHAWASIAVSPQVINLTASDTFSVNVSVSNVTGLCAYDLMLDYDNAVVSAQEISLGDFFPADSFVAVKSIHPANGTVWVAVTVPLGSHLTLNGSGVLATISFKAMSTGNCSLKLRRTAIITFYNNYPRKIPHKTVDGFVQCKIFDHEVAAYLRSPMHLRPGSSFLINGSMVNKGLRDESNVSFQLLIDGVTVNSTIENLLVRGSAVSLTYAFTPTEERKYNVTAYVKPVSNEEYTQNNMVSVNIVVRAQIKVPHDYATIQEAINNAVSGETIVVARGVYHEHLGIDKPLTLLGEDPNTTIIDGGYEKMFVVIIKSDQVVLNGFTLRNGGGAILLEYSNKSTITHNIIENTTDGLSLFRSHDNAITNNTMRHNGKGLFLGYSNNSIIYHNNFINNTDQVKILCSENIWDDGAEGNYWSDYTGQDFDNNGIGDTPYVIDQDNRDDYPLMRQNPIS